VHEPAGIRMLARLAAMSRDCGDEAAAQRHFARARALAETYLPAQHPVATQVAALSAAPANATHTCEIVPAGPVPTGSAPAEDDTEWWPPEQVGPQPEATGGEPAGSGRETPTGPGPQAGSAGAAVLGSWAFGTAAPRTPSPRTAPQQPAEERPPGDNPRTGAGWPEARTEASPPATGRRTEPRTAPPRTGAGWPERDIRVAEGRVSRGHLAAPRRIPVAGQLPDEPGYPGHPVTTFAAPPTTTYTAPPAPAPQRSPVQAPQPAPAHVSAPANQLAHVRHDLSDPYEPTRSRWAGAAFGTGLAVLGVAGGWFAASTLIDRADRPDRPAAATAAAPTPAASPVPPGRIALRDARDSVTLSWTYPGGAEGPVLVAGGRTGEQQRAFQTLAPGTSTYTVYGLAERADYCFTVAVVYSTETVARSAPVCTTRAGSPAARPATSR
jgi:hypothetical protein